MLELNTQVSSQGKTHITSLDHLPQKCINFYITQVSCVILLREQPASDILMNVKASASDRLHLFSRQAFGFLVRCQGFHGQGI